MDYDQYESLPTNNISINMSAGAIAGVMEHCVMYPLDSVKTRMQSLAPNVNYKGVIEALNNMIQQEGILRPVRGMGAVVAGAGPAHALYFSCYEYLKARIQANDTSKPVYFAAGASAVVATVLHDGIMTPAEVVKQRLQMFNSPYRTMMECIRKTYQSEGIKAFYRSYTTQLTMNVPFQSIHFITYEFCQNVTNKERKYNPVAHMTSGALAGAFAAAVTTPLDVCKTLLNTQQHRVAGMVAALRTVYRLGGPGGYFRGLQARVLYQMPSTAICWSMYELFKYLLTPTAGEGLKTSPVTAAVDAGFLLVVPQVNLEAESSKVVVDDDEEERLGGGGAGGGANTSWGGGNSNEWSSLKSTSVSPGSMFGTLSFNTMHRDEDRNSQQIFGITHS